MSNFIKNSKKLSDSDMSKVVGIPVQTLQSWKKKWEEKGEKDWRYNIYILLKSLNRYELEMLKEKGGITKEWELK